MMFAASISDAAECYFGVPERFSLYCQLEQFEGNIIPIEVAYSLDTALKKIADTNGLELTNSAGRFFTNFKISPLLSYEDNINGGNPTGTLEVGDFIFYGEPHNSKKNGFLYGVSAQSKNRLIVKDGFYLNADIVSSVQYSTEHNLSIHGLNGSICGVNNLKNWNFFELCLRSNHLEKQLSSFNSTEVSASLHKYVTTHSGAHVGLTVGLHQFGFPQFKQNQFSVGIHVLPTHARNYKIKINFGQQIANSLSEKFAAEISTHVNILGKNINMFGKHRYFDGGNLIGYPRKDKVYDFGVSYPIDNNIDLKLSVQQTDSNIDYFDNLKPSLGVYYELTNF